MAAHTQTREAYFDGKSYTSLIAKFLARAAQGFSHTDLSGLA
jgi:hypothetical protein